MPHVMLKVNEPYSATFSLITLAVVETWNSFEGKKSFSFFLNFMSIMVPFCQHNEGVNGVR